MLLGMLPIYLDGRASAGGARLIIEFVCSVAFLSHECFLVYSYQFLGIFEPMDSSRLLSLSLMHAMRASR